MNDELWFVLGLVGVTPCGSGYHHELIHLVHCERDESPHGLPQYNLLTTEFAALGKKSVSL